MATPIKRSVHLTPLSRDHHNGLLFSWKLREGIKQHLPASRMRPYVTYFWREHLLEHFREEEDLLFHKLDDPLCEEALAQHAALRGQFESVLESQDESTTEYGVLADLLQQHIRFEERELFPYLEQTLSPQALEYAGNVLNDLHARPWEDAYKDEFWIHKK